MRKLIPYLKNYKKESIIGPLFKLLEAVFELIVPLVTARIIDIGIQNQDIPYIWKMARMYDHKDGYAGVYVVQGCVKISNFKLKIK